MKHILFDFKKCSSDILDNELYIKFSLEGAAEVAGCKILKVETHKFEPQGVTAYALLAESHMSIHTWPEKGIVGVNSVVLLVYHVLLVPSYRNDLDT